MGKGGNKPARRWLQRLVRLYGRIARRMRRKRLCLGIRQVSLYKDVLQLGEHFVTSFLWLLSQRIGESMVAKIKERSSEIVNMRFKVFAVERRIE